jgi:transposase
MLGKKIAGRKRFIAVDSMGLLWALMILPASVQDRVGGVALVQRLHEAVKYLQMLWVDSHFDTAIDYAWRRWGWPGEVVRRLRKQVGFIVLPKRWIVERTFGWFNRSRRLSKDYERTIASSEGFIKLAMIRLMIRRLRTTDQGL